KPAAQVVETQTQLVTTVEHRTKRLKAHKSRDGRTVIRHATPTPAAAPVAAAAAAPVSAPAPVPAPAPVAPVRQSGGADDGAAHDVGDDHGNGAETEPGDDSGGHGANSGSGGGGHDSGESNDD
ncbi:MAG: hypothetical protein QOH13_975, partial [Thermoleophilaceae bacterium]|nr:hypothetical protein [Thermoleophilaceae bacterium]